MRTAWARSRAFVWAIGGHAFLLGLLFVDWNQPMPVAARGQDDPRFAKAVEASLVTAPPQAVAEAAVPQQPVTPLSTQASVQPPPAPPIEARPSLPDVPDTPAEASIRHDATPDPNVAKPAPPSVDTPRPSPAPEPPPTAGNPLSESSQPAPDSDDPYAEMRRQRAEAERAYQLSQQAERQPSNQRAPVAATGPPQDPLQTAFPFSAVSANGPWPSDLQSAAMLFDLDSASKLEGGQQTMRCASRGFGQDDVGRLDERIICLLGLATPLAIEPTQ